MVALRRQTLVIAIAGAVVQMAVAQHFGAMAELEPGLSPRYFFGSPPLMKRQSGVCGAGQHHCQDINQPTICCPDTQYCYINPQGQGSCCALDSICDNPCAVSEYLCGAVQTTAGASASSSCCQRPCSAYSAYQCASTYGGKCCSLGFSCITSACVSTPSIATTLVSISISGCKANQFSCPLTVGGGCCDNGGTCTNFGSQLACATGTNAPSAIRTGPDGSLVSGISEGSPDSGLSSGAKAGIGAGVAVLACIVIAGLLWFCMRRRKAAREAQSNSQQSESVVEGRTQSMSQASRHAGRTRGAGDYFSAARAGPYTDHESPGSVPYRGVPLSPNSPGDIVPAVEIGHSREHSNVTSPGEFSEQSGDHMKSVLETTEHRFELP